MNDGGWVVVDEIVKYQLLNLQGRRFYFRVFFIPLGPVTHPLDI